MDLIHRSSSFWDVAVPRRGCTCEVTAFALRWVSHQLAGKGHLCCKGDKRWWARETRGLTRIQITHMVGVHLGGMSAHLCLQSHAFTLGRTHLALRGSLVYRHQSAPAPGMWEYEERRKPKFTREDGFLNVSTTGEQGFRQEPTHPRAQPPVPSWLAGLSVNVEPNLKYA